MIFITTNSSKHGSLTYYIRTHFIISILGKQRLNEGLEGVADYTQCITHTHLRLLKDFHKKTFEFLKKILGQRPFFNFAIFGYFE